MTSPDWVAFDRELAARRRAFVDGFVEFLRLESVSQAPAKVRATGEWLAATLRARGLEGRGLGAGGHPAGVGGGRGGGAPPTGPLPRHHQTKPDPPEGWR